MKLIFDIGSNATKASLFEPLNGRIMRDWRIETGIGRCIGEDGCLSDEACRRLLEAIGRIHEEAVQMNVSVELPMHAIGTEALRKAGNGNLLIEKIGIERKTLLEIISAEREAELERCAVKMSAAYQKHLGQCVLFIDSGGSSTEFSLLDGDGKILASQSYPFGQHKIRDAIEKCEKLPFDALLDALNAQFACHKPELIIAAGSSVVAYARQVLSMGGQSGNDVESQSIPANVEVSAEDVKAVCGGRLIAALAGILDAPLYVTTLGIRHGWIFENIDKKPVLY